MCTFQTSKSCCCFFPLLFCICSVHLPDSSQHGTVAVISAESSHWFTNEYLCVQHRWWSTFLSFIHTANTTTVYCRCLKCLSCTCAPVEIKILHFSTIVQLCSHSLTMTLKTKVSFKIFGYWRKPAVIQSHKGQFQFFFTTYFSIFSPFMMTLYLLLSAENKAW